MKMDIRTYITLLITLVFYAIMLAVAAIYIIVDSFILHFTDRIQLIDNYLWAMAFMVVGSLVARSMLGALIAGVREGKIVLCFQGEEIGTEQVKFHFKNLK